MKITYLGNNFTLDAATGQVAGDDAGDAGLIESVARLENDEYSPALGDSQWFLKEALEKKLPGLEAFPEEPGRSPDPFTIY